MAKKGAIDSRADVMAASSESEVIAQQVSALSERLAAVETRLGDLDKAIARLEGAALTTVRALEEISRHWTPSTLRCGAEEADVGQLRGERESSHTRQSH
jgi:chromosome segregation ATPase